jgi:hypothetical protein
MKRLVIIILLLSLSCKKPDIGFEDGFTKIDQSLMDRETLIRGISPNKVYDYWEYGFYNPLGQATIMKSSGDVSLKKNVKFRNPEKGFFMECLPAICYSYIAYIENGSVKYITDEAGLKKFIGNIDNLEEAILISKLNGFWFDAEEKKAGSYKKTNDGFELYMMKYYPCPVKMESVKITIDSTGNFQTKSNGIYYESKDCIIS